MGLIFFHTSNKQETEMEGRRLVLADTFAFKVESLVINKQFQ